MLAMSLMHVGVTYACGSSYIMVIAGRELILQSFDFDASIAARFCHGYLPTPGQLLTLALHFAFGRGSKPYSDTFLAFSVLF